ncbi:unnamed protein product [Rhizoctonia solani]|uniref:DUF6593 domain-containing protein n=1 Tax=Rhizoctonia solani TaxID=456999 RepID=A0A8H3CGS2_9AGAM|nr:unnamed protein product [Rhizoctonia solani]CAE6479414.1 unnamed protein product [Rhizoctonia solani]
MATYVLVKNDPRNTALTDLEGNTIYKISTRVSFPNETTTITRAGESELVAIIYWNATGKNTITMNDITRNITDVFPKSSKASISRLVTTGDGEAFKWKYTTKLYCMSETTGLNVATYYHVLFADHRNKKSTIDIAPSAVRYSDLLVVSWMIMAKEGLDGYPGLGS